MIVKVAIGMASLCDIAEKACKVYRRDLAQVEYLSDIECISDSLADVIRLWNAANDFDCDDELILTLERREEQEDGTDRAD